MDWPLAISRNREALWRIVAALFALMGSAAVTALPRRVHAAILIILRPAEAAVRRLIVIAARGLALKPRAPRALPSGLAGYGAVSALKTPAFNLFDPLKHFGLSAYDNNALPHFAFHSGGDAEFHAPDRLPPDEPIDATQLFARLRAIRAALTDIARQARRFARWQARRDVLLKDGRLTRMPIFRPGLPPGWRERRIHEIDDVLRECHGLALHAADTS
jgi:hypothetical protein